MQAFGIRSELRESRSSARSRRSQKERQARHEPPTSTPEEIVFERSRERSRSSTVPDHAAQADRPQAFVLDSSSPKPRLTLTVAVCDRAVKRDRIELHARVHVGGAWRVRLGPVLGDAIDPPRQPHTNTARPRMRSRTGSRSSRGGPRATARCGSARNRRTMWPRGSGSTIACIETTGAIPPRVE